MTQEHEMVMTVHVQETCVWNWGSWNSPVEYELFLHTNSNSFAAKISYVEHHWPELCG